MTAEQLNRIRIPVLVLNGKGDVANQKTARLLEEISNASLGECEGDHNSTPYQPSFHQTSPKHKSLKSLTPDDVNNIAAYLGTLK